MGRRVLLVVLAGLFALLASALATHPVSQSANLISTLLVPNFRQCGVGSNPTNGQHSPPLGVPSCLPPTPQSIGAHFGLNTAGSVNYIVFLGDIQVQVSINDVQTPFGADYDGDSDSIVRDVYAVIRSRLSDHWNCSGSPTSCPGLFDKSGTVADIDFFDTMRIDCISNGDPATLFGSDCNFNTTWNVALFGSLVLGKSIAL